eukprot:CAMPEP_0179042136 /NCGR_PEP_ID=MMETSP0796-20121207/16512_1 /TAXON_ID=73915 /ORGANISM="Pyrodinium bahamense, Strain pbaha01" /LENGTH=246 /DNA_ID=CAMNT_0020738513 /DNA_START=43 /DNA_END=783 /DNA_ORIENTATION=-
MGTMRMGARSAVGLAAIGAALALVGCWLPKGFVAPLRSRPRIQMPRDAGMDKAPHGASLAAGALAAVCGLAAAARDAAKPRRPSRTEVRYTTEKILPSFQWIKAGLKDTDLAPKELRAKTLGGCDVLIGKTEGGKLFCVGNLCPHLGTPMSEGADVFGDVIVCPLHGSSFSVLTGDLIDWCPSPPIIGPLTGLVIEKKNLAIIEVRTSFFGNDVEVLVDTNAKKAYEADYWKGLLDAQGKVDGTYY